MFYCCSPPFWKSKLPPSPSQHSQSFQAGVELIFISWKWNFLGKASGYGVMSFNRDEMRAGRMHEHLGPHSWNYWVTAACVCSNEWWCVGKHKPQQSGDEKRGCYRTQCWPEFIPTQWSPSLSGLLESKGKQTHTPTNRVWATAWHALPGGASS